MHQSKFAAPRWLLYILMIAVALVGNHLAAVMTVAAERRPNVLFLLTDDQRPDTIAALGNEHIQTPNLDRLVRRGTAFTRAVCANPICTPSRAEILTGCSSFRNGVLDFGGKFRDDIPRWPQTMRDAGYRTCYVGKWHNQGRPSDHGYAEAIGLYAGGGGQWETDRVDWKGFPITGYRGWVFQSMDGREKYPDQGVGLTPDISARFADAAIEFIKRDSAEQPFFLHVNFTAPHDPLLMPPGFEEEYDAKKLPLPKNFLSQHPFDHGNLRGRDELLLPIPRSEEIVRETIAMYYAVISHMDQQVGRILAVLDETGQTDNTIIVFSSDHGLGVGSHGLRGKQNMYEHTVNVPLIFAGPGIPRGERRDAQCYLRDLFPTVCELTSADVPRNIDGRNLAAVIAGKDDSVHPYVTCYFRDKQRMIRTDRWKLIHYPELDKYQLFDLDSDPHEMTNLSGTPAHQHAESELREQLRAWQKQVGDPLVTK